jgi:hypothetical protein
MGLFTRGVSVRPCRPTRNGGRPCGFRSEAPSRTGDLGREPANRFPSRWMGIGQASLAVTALACRLRCRLQLLSCTGEMAGGGDLDAEAGEFAMDPAVAPGRDSPGPGAGPGVEWSARCADGRDVRAGTCSRVVASSGRGATAARSRVARSAAVGAGPHAGGAGGVRRGRPGPLVRTSLSQGRVAVAGC